MYTVNASTAPHPTPSPGYPRLLYPMNIIFVYQLPCSFIGLQTHTSKLNHDSVPVHEGTASTSAYPLALEDKWHALTQTLFVVNGTHVLCFVMNVVFGQDKISRYMDVL